MEVTTCGKSFNTDWIAGRQAAGAPLTFGMLQALEDAKNQAAASTKRDPIVQKTGVVVLPASREIVLTMKMADGREVTIKTARPAQPLRECVAEDIRKLAAAEYEKAETLSASAAWIKAADSAAGRPYLEMHRHPDSHLTVEQFVANQTEAKRSTSSARDSVMKAAAELRKADPKLTEPQAFIRALDVDPELAQRYRAELAEQ